MSRVIQVFPSLCHHPEVFPVFLVRSSRKTSTERQPGGTPRRCRYQLDWLNSASKPPAGLIPSATTQTGDVECQPACYPSALVLALLPLHHWSDALMTNASQHHVHWSARMQRHSVYSREATDGVSITKVTLKDSVYFT